MGTDCDRAAPAVEKSIAALIREQHAALERATFVGMNDEEAAEYDDRALRIHRLQWALNREPYAP